MTGSLKMGVNVAAHTRHIFLGRLCLKPSQIPSPVLLNHKEYGKLSPTRRKPNLLWNVTFKHLKDIHNRVDPVETLDRASERSKRKTNYGSNSFNSRHRKRHYHDYGRQHVIHQTDYYHHHHHQDSRVDNQYRGCYNWGLMNHNKSTCYHKDLLRCSNCDLCGHKAICDQSNRFGRRVLINGHDVGAESLSHSTLLQLW